jgi:hypothetical protein
MQLYTFDIRKCLILAGPHILQGFADGEAFSLELDDDLYQKQAGADGDIARARRHGQAGNGKISLMQTSVSNDVLSAFAALDRLSNAGVFPLTVKDLLGTTTAFAAYAWIKKPPALALGKELATREWMLDLANTELFIGGNSPMLF